MIERRSIARLLTIMTLASVALSGCAASGERLARQRWESERTARLERSAMPQAAADTSTVPLTDLPGLLRYAHDNNPGLRAAFELWKAALEQVPQARALPDPRLSYSYFLESIETRVGPQRQRFGVAQTIPLFGKLGLRGAVAVHAANAAAANYETQRQALALRVATKWNDYYALARELEIARDNVRLLEALENTALSQYTAGQAPYSAVLQAQVELGRLEDRLQSLQDRRSAMVAQLNADLNRDAGATLDWPSAIADVGVLDSKEALHDALRLQNPQLARYRALEQLETAALQLSGKSAIPDLTLGVDYIETGSARNSGVGDSGKDALVAMASLNVPLWYGKYRAQRGQALARREAARLERQQLERTLLAKLESAHYEYRDATRRIELYQLTLLPKARQALEVLEDAFVTGEATFLDMIDAQRTLLEFETGYEHARANRATRYAELQTLVGNALFDGSTKQQGARP